MEKEPLISVIMSEYNTNEQLLRNSINSIIKQTYKNFELIIIDDSGIDALNKVSDVLEDVRIKIYKNEKNMGLVYSLNKALELAKGKYIARMDTDDISYNNRLEVEVKYLEEHPEVDLVASNIEYYDGNWIWGRTKGYGEINKNDLLNGSPIAHPTIMAKRKTMLNVGGYPNYNRCEDYAMWIELVAQNYKLYKIEDVLLRYHLSIDDYKKRTLKNRKGFFRLINTQYKKLKPSVKDVIKIKLKTLIAGIIPHKIMYYYHKRKAKI